MICTIASAPVGWFFPEFDQIARAIAQETSLSERFAHGKGDVRALAVHLDQFEPQQSLAHHRRMGPRRRDVFGRKAQHPPYQSIAASRLGTLTPP